MSLTSKTTGRTAAEEHRLTDERQALIAEVEAETENAELLMLRAINKQLLLRVSDYEAITNRLLESARLTEESLREHTGAAVKSVSGDKYAEYYEIKQRAHATATAEYSAPAATPKSIQHSFGAGDTVYATSQYDSTLTFSAYKVDKVIYDELSREAMYRLVDPQGIRPTILQPESCVNVTMFANETETAIVPMSKDAKAAALAAKEKLASAALGGTAKAAATGAAQASAQTAAQTATVAASVATPVTAVAGAAVAGIEKAVKAITR